ncbi:MAG: high-affinity branched-chain amino acid ABC transporter permease LivM, partial [Desulfatiglandales bacterium]
MESEYKKRSLHGLVFLGLILLPQFVGNYWSHILGDVGLYVMLGIGLNVVVGLAGLLDLGYVAFFGIGAYSYAL